MFGVPVTGYVIVLCKENDMLAVIGVLVVIALTVSVVAIVIVLRNSVSATRAPAIRITRDEVLPNAQADCLEQRLTALQERNARLMRQHETLAEIETELAYRADLERGIAEICAAIRISRPARSAPVPPSAAPPPAPPAVT